MIPQHHTEPECQQNSPCAETPCSTHVVPQRDTFPESAGRCSEFDQPSQDLAMEPGLDLETASHTWNKCWRPSRNSDVEPHDGNCVLTKDQASHSESSKEGGKGNHCFDGRALGRILQGPP